MSDHVALWVGAWQIKRNSAASGALHQQKIE